MPKILLRFLIFCLPISIFISCQNTKKQAPTDVFSVVPPETIGILEVRQADILTADNLGEQASILAPVLQKSIGQIELLSAEGITPGTLLCVGSVGKSEVAWTLIKNHRDSLPPLRSDRIYSGISIEKNETDKGTWYRALVNSIELRSTSELHLENCIRIQKEGEENPLTATLLPLQKASQPNAPVVWYYLASEEWMNHLSWNKPSLLPHSAAQWVMYDGRFEKQTIALDGISSTYDSVPSIYTLLNNLEAQPLKSLALLPQDFDELLVIPTENSPLLSNNFQQFARDKNLPLTDSAIPEFNPFDEICFIEAQGEQALLLHRNGSSDSTLPFQWEEEGQFRKFKLGYVSLTPALETFMKVWGIDKRINIGTWGPSFVYLASSQSFLEKLLTDQLNGRTLERSQTLQKYFKNELSNRSSYLWLCATTALANQETSESTATAFPYIGLQAQVENNLVHLHSSFVQKSDRKSTAGLRSLASIDLEAPLAGKLQWVKNHKTQADDLLAYDQKNNLYLFSNTGKAFWKKQLSGGIIGPVSQVDLYKNKRLQLAFRTENKWLILDRNGKVVLPFDIKLPSTAPIQPLAVFDYDNKREYRFLLAQGKELRMYDRRGKTVRGFKAKKTSAPLLGAPQHFRIKNKDYIVFAQSNNELKILNRQGLDRIRVKEKINFSQNKVYNYLNSFTTTDLDGKLVQVDRKGNLNTSDLQLGADHKIDLTSKSMVSFSENILTIKGIPVTLPYGSYTAPEIFYLNNILYITITNLETQQLYCFYSNGTAVQGFPAYGSGPAQLRYNAQNKTIEIAVPGEGNSILLYDFTTQP